MDVLAGSFAVSVGVLHLGWQEVFHALVAIHGVTFQLTGFEYAKFVQRFQISAVDETGIEVGGHGVDGDPGSQFAIIPDSGAGTDEIQTSTTEEFVKRVS